MRLFNAIQMTALFASWPFLVTWLFSQTGTHYTVGAYAACLAYVFSFGGMTAALYSCFEREKW